ncbi:MAG: TrkA family potassium uptake protein [Thermoleophilia bacterium]|nr:TrkA family potassium uptake protein [Thermoleophilia bacterium]
MARRGEFLVIGLGRFGGALAADLVAHDHEVLGVDVDAKLVQSFARTLTHVVQADSTDIEAMRQLGAADFATAVVAIGTDLEASILTTSVLVDLKARRIVAKAISESHGKILERIGADRVIFPERDMGVRVARSLAGRDVIDYMELDPGFVLLETRAPPELVGKTLAEAQVRKRFGLTVVSIKSPNQPATYATPETVPRDGDILVVAGETKKVEEFAQVREA